MCTVQCNLQAVFDPEILNSKNKMCIAKDVLVQLLSDKIDFHGNGCNYHET